ncbi:MAG: hypothetical protein UU47_C0020G0008 [candidate division TM6 bacterium GW2011_GWE2_41_16]|nr:MAG: hypothetical protein UU47_C0020G0008 [candidate division TM6 bacterium GW2011_GWE2_41_16]
MKQKLWIIAILYGTTTPSISAITPQQALESFNSDLKKITQKAEPIELKNQPLKIEKLIYNIGLQAVITQPLEQAIKTLSQIAGISAMHKQVINELLKNISLKEDEPQSYIKKLRLNFPQLWCMDESDKFAEKLINQTATLFYKTVVYIGELKKTYKAKQLIKQTKNAKIILAQIDKAHTRCFFLIDNGANVNEGVQFIHESVRLKRYILDLALETKDTELILFVLEHGAYKTMDHPQLFLQELLTMPLDDETMRSKLVDQYLTNLPDPQRALADVVIDPKTHQWLNIQDASPSVLVNQKLIAQEILFYRYAFDQTTNESYSFLHAPILFIYLHWITQTIFDLIDMRNTQKKIDLEVPKITDEKLTAEQKKERATQKVIKDMHDEFISITEPAKKNIQTLLKHGASPTKKILQYPGTIAPTKEFLYQAIDLVDPASSLYLGTAIGTKHDHPANRPAITWITTWITHFYDDIRNMFFENIDKQQIERLKKLDEVTPQIHSATSTPTTPSAPLNKTEKTRSTTTPPEVQTEPIAITNEQLPTTPAQFSTERLYPPIPEQIEKIVL